MVQALRKTGGIVKTAAEMCGIGRSTHHQWMREDDDYKIEVQNIAEESVDFTESKLFELIAGVELEEEKAFVVGGKIKTVKIKRKFAPDTASVIFYLKTKGKERGYVEKSILSMETNDLKNMSEQELDAKLNELQTKIQGSTMKIA